MKAVLISTYEEIKQIVCAQPYHVGHRDKANVNLTGACVLPGPRSSCVGSPLNCYRSVMCVTFAHRAPDTFNQHLFFSETTPIPQSHLTE